MMTQDAISIIHQEEIGGQNFLVETSLEFLARIVVSEFKCIVMMEEDFKIKDFHLKKCCSLL